MKKNSFFWVGYSDLMTSLFFIMLVLFVVSIGFLNNKMSENIYIIDENNELIDQLERERNATQKQLDKIEELQASVQQLPEEYFSYQPKYKRFKLNKQIQFAKESAIIDKNYYGYLIKVGNEISRLISNMNADEKYKNLDIKYLIVIEGMASIDNYDQNFELSYQRALSLYRLWKSKGINFRPEICEIQIAGSGTDGVREYKNEEEFKNQQFLIHIVPKMGKILNEK